MLVYYLEFCVYNVFYLALICNLLNSFKNDAGIFVELFVVFFYSFSSLFTDTHYEHRDNIEC